VHLQRCIVVGVPRLVGHWSTEGEVVTVNFQDLCWEWQKALRLTDWEIHVERIDSMADNGDTHINFMKKQANIRIRSAGSKGHTLKPDDIPDAEWFPEETEEISLVHELLHLLFYGFDRTDEGSIESDMVEFAATAISHALVRAGRTER